MRVHTPLDEDADAGTVPTLELHCCNSPNNEKVFILLEELGLEYAIRYRSIWKLEQYAPDFVALNPNAKMPVLIDRETPSGDPIVLFESGVILQYLAEKHGRFLPEETAARYEVLKWTMFQMANIGPVIGNYFHFRRFAPPESDYALTRFGNEARRLYGVMESRLSESAHLGGPEFSIADVAVHPWVRLHPFTDVDLGEHPALSDWLARCDARPGLARAYEKTEAFRAGFEETVRTTPEEHLDRIFGRSPRSAGATPGSEAASKAVGEAESSKEKAKAKADAKAGVDAIRPPGSVDWSALLPERTGVDVDALPWEAFVDAEGHDRGVRFKWIVDPARGRNCMLLHLPPDHRAPGHWHTSDALYLVIRGELVIEGEGSFLPGQVRWVRGGFAYGSEGAGPDGCDFYFFSLGPYGQHDPDVDPPPEGRWDDLEQAAARPPENARGRET